MLFRHPDPLLVNPWGISRRPVGSPFWTSNQGSNTSTLYAVTNGTSVSQVLTVNANGVVGIPTTAGGLWGLAFGSGMGNGGSSGVIYFIIRITWEAHGLFGAISTPEPSGLAALGLGEGGGCGRWLEGRRWSGLNGALAPRAVDR